jgi:hypothetical protein
MKAVWLIVALLGASAFAQSPAQVSAPQVWPAIPQSAKPWTRWWWPGSAVDPAGLRGQLEQFAAAGLGGVEITPIYGARGAESRNVDFLSPRWVELLGETTREAARLGLGVDMATGTGWPFGGPTVSAAEGSSAFAFIDGKLAGRRTDMKVKRAAPGGEGRVLDPYSSAALARYLENFSTALKPLPPKSLRGQFHDSFEYYEAGWTPTLSSAFREMHGYALEPFAAALIGKEPLDADELGRVKGDYRRTLARLHLDYVSTWVEWSRAHGFEARNQAHGAPGNLLDLYAVADVPETESFGNTPFPIAGLRADPAESKPDPDPPENLIGRFASSAAHVAGRPLVSSETLTWMRENFREPLSAAKPQLDRLFAAGINHVFYHGIAYSPADAAWPGWFFYASTQFGPANPNWRDFAAMNAYVARVQSVLQAGKPDNDVLVYWPFDDVVDDPEGLMRQYGVHDNAWLVNSSTGALMQKLFAEGITFDLISDAQLQRVKATKDSLVAPGGSYRALFVPAARRMSPETLRKLGELRDAGAKVYFESLPADVPGKARLEERRAELRALLAHPSFADATITAGAPLLLQPLGIRQEAAARAGLAFVRRARDDGHDYFFANLGAGSFDGWLDLGTPAAVAWILDPLTGVAGTAAVAEGAGGNARVYLQLSSGESLLVRTFRKAPPGNRAARWRYVERVGPGVGLDGPWRITFVDGGPELPADATLRRAGSWTELEDERSRRFSGTARYRIEFDAPADRADDWLLDLGDVRESARVILNGQPLATAWSLPFVVRLGGALRPTGNVLEVDVTNLPANRIRDLDLRKVEWKIMRDANLVTLHYKPFDASQWAVTPSGLLGPVRLVPLRSLEPRQPSSAERNL